MTTGMVRLPALRADPRRELVRLVYLATYQIRNAANYAERYGLCAEALQLKAQSDVLARLVGIRPRGPQQRKGAR